MTKLISNLKTQNSKPHLKTKNFLPIFLLFVSSLVLLRALLKPTFLETHDGQNHLARLANLKMAAVALHFPPRWAPNLNYKFGYPIFNFNYYFPHALALIPARLGFSFEQSLKIIIFLSFFMGGAFWYLSFYKKLGKVPALAGALFYIAAPFQLVTILVRGSFGEIVGFGMLPICLWAIVKMVKKPSRLTFIIAVFCLLAFLLTHNITVLFGMPFLAIFCLAFLWQRKKWKKLWLAVIAFVLSIGLSMFFWLPAFLEKKFINLDKIDLVHQYSQHFLNLKQLFYSPWGFGFSIPGPNDGLSLQLGPVHCLVAVFSTLYLIKAWKNKKIKEYKILWFFFSICFFLSVFLMTKSSLFIWKAFPFLHYFQFPWRLLMVSILGVAFFATTLTKTFPKTGLILALLAAVFAFLVAKTKGGFNWSDNFYHNFTLTTTIKDEYMPIWFDKEKNYKIDADNKIVDLNGALDIKEVLWKTQKHQYEIKTDRQTEIVERTAYFPGWEVRIDGQKADINFEREDYPGLISFKIPKGEHSVETVFTENTPARRVGNIVSIISAGLLLLIGILWKKINPLK